jgi:hypothetical protein
MVATVFSEKVLSWDVGEQKASILFLGRNPSMADDAPLFASPPP